MRIDSLTAYINGVNTGTLDPKQVMQTYQNQAKNNELNSRVSFHDEYVQDNIESLVNKPLCGAPIGIKDIILTKGYETTFGSKIGTGYIPPYSAHCFELLEDAGGCMIGKCSMDEFAMGGSNENPYYGPCKNPYDHTRVSGGSSGGSAASVANDECLAALGTDTGGSVRQPAALCGIVGAKPTYGRVSRFGVQAMASSLDQVGTLTKTVDDASLLLGSISGYDPRDSNSQHQADTKWKLDEKTSPAGLKFALPIQYLAQGIDPDVKQSILETIEALRSQGAIIDEIDLPLLSYGIPAYYILMPAEAHSNLARFDGMRFGLQSNTQDMDTIYDYYAQVRDEGFGDEVKRRILTGAYVLSAGFYDAYYNQAKRFQTTLRQRLGQLFTDYDAIVGPTSPTPAWKIGSKENDPIANYLADIYTVIANLSGCPALSVPVGTVDREGVPLPIGFQIMTKPWNEGMMFTVGKCVENLHR